MTSSTVEPLSIDQLKTLLRPCVDVRSASEFSSGHIPGAINISMDEIESRLADIPSGAVLVCQSGKRAAITYSLLQNRIPDLGILAGGTDAWRSAGNPVVASTRSRWALERQVRLGAGIIVLTGIGLGFLVAPAWFGLAAFAGAGLVFAGATNICMMGHLLAMLPWNQPAKTALKVPV